MVNMTDSDLNVAAEAMMNPSVQKKLSDRTMKALIAGLLLLGIAGAVAFGLYRFRGGGTDDAASVATATEPSVAKSVTAPVLDETAAYCAAHGKNAGFSDWYCNKFTPEWENQRAAISELQDKQVVLTTALILVGIIAVLTMAMLILVIIKKKNKAL